MSGTSETVSTSFSSHYVTDGFYENVLSDVKVFDGDFPPVSLELRAEAERVLFKESRLIDELRLEEWLSLFSEESLYWVPTVPGGGDPRKEVSIAFDDRRRLEDRIYRIRTGYAYSQLPLSRTRRMLTNIEVTERHSTDELFVRTNFILSEFRVGVLESFSGWIGYKMIKEKGEWKIKLKMVNLIDSDQAHDNLTFIL
ncbi:aromatic-ring-hydroxylating dioxygenase subunit beta [Siminovitchia acidinfaciens]|uniref:aromatic-ring-hydroxylating dioxygenase subunit beta n=1 Tax=Siminovitchia acidinfaciens TaxID=2321395 RepID=UPI001F32DB00|nr:aromatic-ring-hydroxylating dioxygenase subunit beta [Siminovitchia acidinfaciens]